DNTEGNEAVQIQNGTNRDVVANHSKLVGSTEHGRGQATRFLCLDDRDVRDRVGTEYVCSCGRSVVEEHFQGLSLSGGHHVRVGEDLTVRGEDHPTAAALRGLGGHDAGQDLVGGLAGLALGRGG